MPSSFTINTTQNNALDLDAQRHGEVEFKVNNVRGRALRGRAQLKPADQKIESWLKVDGDAEREFVIAEPKTYKVLITAPANAGPGTYPFQFNMIDVADEENFSEGPLINFKVLAAKPVHNLTPLIIAGVVVLLLALVGIVGFFIVSGNNAATQAALATANASGTQVAQSTLDAQNTATAVAAATNAIAQATLNAQSTTSAVQTRDALAAANAQKTADAQATLAAGTATAIANAASTATAIANAAAKYNGDWIKNNSSPAGIKQLAISSSGANVTLKVTADYRDILTANGAWANAACNPPCSWGETIVAFKDDPLVATLPIQSRLAHVLTLALSGDQLSVADQTKIDGTQRFAVGYIFSRSCSFLNCVFIPRPFPNVICQITKNC